MKTKTIFNSKLEVIISYASVLTTLVIFEWIERSNLKSADNRILMTMIAGTLLGLIVWIYTFYKFYWKTKWWKYVHQSFKNYDEREQKFIGEATRKSYAVFSVTILAILLVLQLLKWYPGPLLVVALLYFAHTLPASILKWEAYKI